MFRIILFMYLFTLLLSCEKKEMQLIKKPEFNLIIQPYTDISEESVRYVSSKLKKTSPNVKILKPISLPKNAFYEPRNRYRADLLIKTLANSAKANEVYLGITSKDISVKKNTEKDWGVLGLGYKPGKSCVISSFRLSKMNKNEQLFKVAIHELGHTQGLNHCPVKFCYMRDAEGGNPTNEETDFCKKCKDFLINKGWNFNS